MDATGGTPCPNRVGARKSRQMGMISQRHMTCIAREASTASGGIMSEMLTESEKHERLAKIMSGFQTAMLVTHGTHSHLRSRPLAVAEAKGDGVIYFATSATSDKVREIENNPAVNVSMQDDRKFVSITGNARLTRDRQLIDKLWSNAWKVWFPRGKEDPNLLLIEVEPVEAQYWDAGGLEGLKYLFQAAKALVTGSQPDSDGDERRHSKLTM